MWNDEVPQGKIIKYLTEVQVVLVLVRSIDQSQFHPKILSSLHASPFRFSTTSRNRTLAIPVDH